jgi:octopine/nopaline transport system permease protein
MDWPFLLDTTLQLLSGVPLALQLAALSLTAGMALAVLAHAAMVSGVAPLRWIAVGYIDLFRGTPLLVQIFFIYYGLGQIPAVRESALWPILREPYWCAVLALALNTSAYSAEIIRGALAAVPPGEVEAARACGMSGLLLRRRIVWPIALRHGLPIYGSEAILMVKATSMTSIITLTEITGIAHKLIASTYRVVEIFVAAGAIYLTMTFLLTLVIGLAERRMNAHLTHRRN